MGIFQRHLDHMSYVEGCTWPRLDIRPAGSPGQTGSIGWKLSQTALKNIVRLLSFVSVSGNKVPGTEFIFLTIHTHIGGVRTGLRTSPIINRVDMKGRTTCGWRLLICILSGTFCFLDDI